MKLTESIIDQLIAEQIEKLDEKNKINTPKIDTPDFTAQFRSPQGRIFKRNKKIDVKIKSLANNDNQSADISVDDIVDAYKQNDADELDAINYMGQGLSIDIGGKLKKPFNDLKNDAIAQLQQMAQDQSMDMRVGKTKIEYEDVQKSINNWNLANASMQDATPKLPRSLKNLFDVLSLDSTTLDGRLKKISEFSKNVLLAAANDDTAKKALNKMGTLKFTQYALAVDYLSTISKAVDSGSGAYLFETFLAALSGGNVAGKEQTKKGKSGGADFTFGSGVNARGSSKYLKDTSAATQAFAGFEKEETVHYVVATKILDKGNAPKVSSQDPDQLIGFNIYYPVLHVIIPKLVFRWVDTNGIQVGDLILATDQKNLNIKTHIKSFPNDTHIAQLMLVNQNGEIFRDLLNKAVDNMAGDINKAFDKFQVAFDKVDAAKESVGGYAVSGKQKDGEDAIDNLFNYQAALKEVFNILKQQSYSTPASAPGKAAKGYEEPDATKVAKLNENNLENILDKMIQEVILTK